MPDQIAKGLVIIQSQLRAIGDGGRSLATETVLAVAAGTSDIEPGTSGLHRIGRAVDRLRPAGIENE